MRILAIETATEACSVALFENDELVDSRHEILGRGHAERLVPLIAELPGKGRADEIRVSLGPGSFTGTRIGLAAAHALAIAWECPLRGFPTLALVAATARANSQAAASQIGVAMTGGHGEYFIQEFDAQGVPQGNHASLPPVTAAKAVGADIVAGNKAREMVELRGFGVAMELLPDARHALNLPRNLLTTSLAPIYGRGPDARLPAK